MIDDITFFREATLRICGHLDIENGLCDTISFVSQHMPGDSIYLERYELELGAWRLVARATPEIGEKIDILVPLPPAQREAQMKMAATFKRGNLPPVLIVNDSSKEPVTECILEAIGAPPSSALAMALQVEAHVIGVLAILADGLNRFNGDHARLFETLRKPFYVAMSNTLRHTEVVKLKDRLADDNRYLHRELQRIAGDDIVGADFGLRELMRLVRQVAPTESPVLLSGETGAGKDVIANAIHLASPRRNGPFIAVNCGAIPEALIDSELFGHEKGAFTGALAQKRGRFERADKGTILLDEIGEMPLDAQVRLLRVLQHREVERLGGTERIPVDIRIIAATNRDLQTMIREGRFREDLWYRLNVFPIVVPPLRERASDIPALVRHFIDRKAKDLKLGFTPHLAEGAIDTLMAYDWPGNVRELENIIERAMILHRGEPLTFDGLTPSGPRPSMPSNSMSVSQSLALDTVVSDHIKQVLQMTGGKIHGPGGAGELLELNPNTLRYKMRKLGIPFRKG